MSGKGKRTWWMSLLRIEDWVGNISAESLGSNIPIFKPKGCQILALPERRSSANDRQRTWTFPANAETLPAFFFIFLQIKKLP